MNIVYTFDDGYSEITAVSIVSLLNNNQHIENLKLYIIDCGIKEANKIALTELVQSYGRNVTYIPAIDLSQKICVELDTSYWNQVCYIRLFFAELLPQLDKVMHIDCDTIVRGDISCIYDIDLNGYVYAACYDCSPCPKISAGFEECDPYYSNGFLIFNLKTIRDEGIEKKFVRYIEEKKGKLPHLDQDVINGVARDKVRVLPPQYNLMSITALFSRRCIELFSENEPYYSIDELINAVKNPIVVHFVGYQFISRPWAQPCYHPYNDEWIQYYKLTPYWSNNRMLKYKKKKYGMAREAVCWLWNLGYKSRRIRLLLFVWEKKATWKYKKELLAKNTRQ